MRDLLRIASAAGVAGAMLAAAPMQSAPGSVPAGQQAGVFRSGAKMVPVYATVTDTTSSKCSSGSTSRLMIASGTLTVTSWWRAENPCASTDR